MLQRNQSLTTNSHKRKKGGFSFVEIMVVIMIIGLLAAIVGINLLPAVDEARKKTTVTNMRSLESALDLYRLHSSNYPSSEQGLKALKTKPEIGTIPKNWNGPYIKQNLPKDGWDNEFQYTNNSQSYEIISYGADGVEGGSDLNEDINSKDF